MIYVLRLVYPCLTIIKLCLLFQSLSLSWEQHFCYAFENPLMRESHVTIILLLRRWQLSKYYVLNHSSEQLEKAFANLVRIWNKVIQYFRCDAGFMFPCKIEVSMHFLNVLRFIGNTLSEYPDIFRKYNNIYGLWFIVEKYHYNS